jgi:hypothetical protein
LAVVVLALGSSVVSALQAEILINPRGWKFPNVVTSAKEIIRISDRTREIPGKETILKGYRKGDGTYFRTYEVEGKVFGVEIDTDGKAPFEYNIMDTDGDGRFETKIPNSKGNKDKAYVPQWIVDHYYRLHPELKNPTVGTKIPPPSLRPPPAPPAREEPAPDQPPPPEVHELPSP